MTHMVIFNQHVLTSMFSKIENVIKKFEYEAHLAEDYFFLELQKDIEKITDKKTIDEIENIQTKRKLDVLNIKLKSKMFEVAADVFVKKKFRYMRNKMTGFEALVNDKLSILKETADLTSENLEKQHECNKWFLEQMEKTVEFSEKTKEAKEKYLQFSERWIDFHKENVEKYFRLYQIFFKTR